MSLLRQLLNEIEEIILENEENEELRNSLSWRGKHMDGMYKDIKMKDNLIKSLEKDKIDLIQEIEKLKLSIILPNYSESEESVSE